MEIVTADMVLAAYASGYFPMARHRHASTIEWFYPQMRGILPLDEFHIPRSLAKFMRKQTFTVSLDAAFSDVIRACADTRAEGTWINDEIIALYTELHEKNYAHSVECWEMENGKPALVGGIYGLSLGRAFFGESMFSLRPNASKVALANLIDILKANHFTLFDTQFKNEHIAQFGVIEISRDEYLARLKKALYPSE